MATQSNRSDEIKPSHNQVDKRSESAYQELQAKILARLPHDLKLIVGKHSDHWNYGKLETLEKMAEWLEQHNQEEWSKAKRAVESEVYSQLLMDRTSKSPQGNNEGTNHD